MMWYHQGKRNPMEDRMLIGFNAPVDSRRSRASSAAAPNSSMA